MAIWGTMSKPDITQDRPTDDRITKIEESIEELRKDFGILLELVLDVEAEIKKALRSTEVEIVGSTDDPTAERTIGQNNSVIAALKILAAIPFTHDLDDQEMHDCVKASNRIYRAKVIREKKLGCLGRLPVERQILAWIIINYRTLNPEAIDIHRFLDGLFRIADYVPTDINWNFGETNARSFRWMNDALIVSVPEDEFPF